MWKKSTGVLVVASALAGAVSAQPVNVMGIGLGAVLDRPIRECTATPDRDWCTNFRTITERAGIERAPIPLMPPKAADPMVRVPSWVDRAFLAIDKDDEVGRLSITVKGIDRQQEIVAVVSERFGPPKVSEVKEVQTRGGLKYTEFSATWETQGLVIAHGCSRIDQCTLSFNTAKWMAAQAEKARRQAEKDKL